MGLKWSSPPWTLWALNKCPDDPCTDVVVFSFYTSENRGSEGFSNFPRVIQHLSGRSAFHSNRKFTILVTIQVPKLECTLSGDSFFPESIQDEYSLATCALPTHPGPSPCWTWESEKGWLECWAPLSGLMQAEFGEPQ